MLLFFRVLFFFLCCARHISSFASDASHEALRYHKNAVFHAALQPIVKDKFENTEYGKQALGFEYGFSGSVETMGILAGYSYLQGKSISYQKYMLLDTLEGGLGVALGTPQIKVAGDVGVLYVFEPAADFDGFFKYRTSIGGLLETPFLTAELWLETYERGGDDVKQEIDAITVVHQIKAIQHVHGRSALHFGFLEGGAEAGVFTFRNQSLDSPMSSYELKHANIYYLSPFGRIHLADNRVAIGAAINIVPTKIDRGTLNFMTSRHFVSETYSGLRLELAWGM